METIKVSDVYDSKNTTTAIFPEDVPLEEIIAKLADDPCLRGVFLVDSRQRFAGVITRTDLLKWAYLQFGRPAGSSGVHISRRDIYDFVISGKAQDVARGDWRTLGVRLNDTLEEALRQMFEHEAIDLPVLAQDGKILGDLRLSQVLREAIEAAKKEAE